MSHISFDLIHSLFDNHVKQTVNLRELLIEGICRELESNSFRRKYGDPVNMPLPRAIPITPNVNTKEINPGGVFLVGGGTMKWMELPDKTLQLIAAAVSLTAIGLGVEELQERDQK
jgi:hypothetical protein